MRPFAECEAFEPDYDAIEHVAGRTLTLAFTKATSRGGGLSIDPAHFNGDKKVIRHYLAARNIAEQLKATQGMHSRATTPLVNSNPPLLEPIQRAYGHFGHFDIDGKRYASADQRSGLAYELVKLAAYATTERTYSGSSVNNADGNIDYHLLTVDNDGDLAITTNVPLRVRTRQTATLCLRAKNFHDYSVNGMVEDFLRCTSEAHYKELCRISVTRGYFTVAEENAANPPQVLPTNNAMRDELRTLFTDASIVVQDGTKVRASKVIAVVNRAVASITRITQSLNFRVKDTHLPKYEGGSRAQLGFLQEDILYAEFPLNMEELTMCAAVGTARGGRWKYRTVLEEQPMTTLDELISQSFIT
jgi:hypothetical protein